MDTCRLQKGPGEMGAVWNSVKNRIGPGRQGQLALGSRVLDQGFRVFGFGLWGLGALDLGFMVQGSRIWGLRVQGFRV